MGMAIDSRGLLESLGFDENEKYDLPEDLNELSTSSLRGFINQTFLSHSAVQATALIHVTGPSVVGHSAPLRTVGSFMVHLQAAFDSVGASIAGFKSLRGSIPSSLAKRTELALVASPLPGSVLLEVAPTKPRLEDLYPEGETLFDLEETIGAKPLADSAFEELASLMSELAVGEPDQDKFVEHLSDLGPRVASSVQRLCDAVDKDGIDVDFEWRPPSGVRKRVCVTHAYAKFVSMVIKNACVDTEPVEVVGTLVTVTTSDKDRLRVREDAIDGGAKEVTFHIGDIPPEQLRGLQPGDRVQLDGECQVYNCAGGRKREKLVGIGIRKLQSLSERAE